MNQELEVVKYSVTDAAINTMRDRLKEITDDKIEELREQLDGLEADTPTGYAMVMRGLSETRGLRVTVEKVRKELKADSLLWGRTVDSEAKRITASLEELETPLKLTRHKADVVKEMEEIARLEAERKLREAKEAAERAERDAQEAEGRAIREAEHKERMRIEAEKLAIEQAKFAEQKKIADAEAARAREEIEKAKARQAEEKKVAQAEIKAEKLRLEKEQIQAREKAAAAQAILDAEAEKIAEEARKAAESKEKAADTKLRKLFETDTTVLQQYAKDIESVIPGNLNSKQAKELVEHVHSEVVTAVDEVWRMLSVYEIMR